MRENKTIKEFLNEQEASHEADRLALKVGDRYFTIHESAEGYDYSVYDKEFDLIDGGIIEETEQSIFTVTRELLSENYLNPQGDKAAAHEADFEEVSERACNVELSKIVGKIKYSAVTCEFVRSSPDFKDHDLPLYHNRDGDKYVLGFGHLGNGTVVWNYLHETDNDYTTVAHIDEEGNAKIYDKKLPYTAITAIEKQAELVRLREEERHYPMPDPSVTIEECRSFGYTAEELLPLSSERAKELYDADVAVYALYPDNTEAAVMDVAEFVTHDGYFGVETDDWARRVDLHVNHNSDILRPPKKEKAISIIGFLDETRKEQKSSQKTKPLHEVKKVKQPPETCR